MLRAMGSQAGRFQHLSQIFKNHDFFQKKYPHKTKSICLVKRFSPETTKKKNMIDYSPMLPAGPQLGGKRPLKFLSPTGKCVGHSWKNLGSSQKIIRPPWCPKLVKGLASRYFSDYAPVIDACLSHLIQ